MDLKLNIYAKNSTGRYEIEKAYIAETANIMFGTVEDLIGLLDGVKIGDNDALIRVITKGFAQLKPFLKEIFVGVTDDELKRTKIQELIPLFVDIFKETLAEIGKLSKRKN